MDNVVIYFSAKVTKKVREQIISGLKLLLDGITGRDVSVQESLVSEARGVSVKIFNMDGLHPTTAKNMMEQAYELVRREAVDMIRREKVRISYGPLVLEY